MQKKKNLLRNLKPYSKDLHIRNDGHSYGGTSNKFNAYNPPFISSSMLISEIGLMEIINTDRLQRMNSKN
ncbi:hypothetical protein LCM02_15700 [Lutimonas saemankumensis]|uniref:hypothetical protein n=1 Tax=Lutimonas saemankumensis TaxID=483016 RepID=UPI001CD7A6D2|nr:hypothetical protein [Lutimonas saemankumensis]MCA0933906.1 hypothetical protein [Lutimonas saemankumensis]